MEINPRLAALLENDDIQSLQAVLLWFNADSQSLKAHSQRLSAVLDEAQSLPVERYYDIAQELNLDNMVELSILNEFGPEFRSKSCFDWLNRTVVRRLSC